MMPTPGSLSLEWHLSYADLYISDCERRAAGVLTYRPKQRVFVPLPTFPDWRALLPWEIIQHSDIYCVPFGDWGLGMTPDGGYSVYDFWVGRYAGRVESAPIQIYRPITTLRGNRHYAKGLPLP